MSTTPTGYRIAADYEPGMSGRLCFITQMPLREVDETVPGGGTARRKEKVIVTPRVIDPGTIAPPPEPGMVAISEMAVRQMAALLGLVPVDELNAQRALTARESARRESAEAVADALRQEVAALRARLDAGVTL